MLSSPSRGGFGGTPSNGLGGTGMGGPGNGPIAMRNPSMASIMSAASSALSSTVAGAVGRTTAPLKAQPLILFDVQKREAYSPATTLKAMQRRLRAGFKIAVNKDEITLNRIFEASLLVFCGPKDKFTSAEFSALKSYLDIGGSILYLVGEGGETASGSNFNYLLEEYGMSVNADSVTRTSYFKYFHPKEAFVDNGVLNREFERVAEQYGGHLTSSPAKPASTVTVGADDNGLSFVFPFGATINVQKPSIPILSSGSMSYPLNRPIAAVYSHPNGKGKLAVVASVDMFADQYMDKEDNGKIFQVLIDWLTSDRVQLNSIDANEPEIADYHYLPDTMQLAERPRACLQETEDLPRDFTKLFDHTLFTLDLTHVPAAIQAYSALRLKHEPLTLIQPQFETPLPALQPAVFPPMLRDLPAPPLELFDLDEHLASPAAKLAQLAAKCTDDDLEYYVREAGTILGIADRISAAELAGPAAAKVILDFAFRHIVNWKRLHHAV
ncbi:Intraflagellar transport protein 52 [Allomyces arbusculus]|nr:Intraflagellar transport protein 52 [Allomyces arbusculus]